jgi:pimeloyl-ACP methyl ester carboxylesterase
VIGTIHPVRWAAVLAVALPTVFAAAALFAKLSGTDVQRPLRLLRYVLAAELIGLLTLCTIGYLYEQRARAHDARLYQPPGRLVDIGGYQLYLNCTGRGAPTVVLEYGLEGSYLDWHKVQPEIARFTRVCSYDRAGYGWSDSSPRARVPSVMAGELHTLLHAAGEKPPYILVGHSYGSAVAQTFAYKFPDKTAGLILVDGVHLRPSPVFPLSHRLWLKFMQWTLPFGLPRWRHWCAGGPPELQAMAEAANCRSRAYAAFYREWSQLGESGAEMRGVTNLGNIPLVVISRDPVLGHDRDEETRHAQQQRDALKLSSNSRLMVAEGSGHDIPLARPDVIVDAVKSLLKPQEPAGSQGTP